MKIYAGYRLPGDRGTAAEARVTVHEEGQEPRPLALRHDLRRHSESFNWGFAGSGPAQLALALAADVLGDDEGQAVYQRLKFRLVGRLPQDGWSLSEEQLRRVLGDVQEQERDRSP